MFQTKFKQLVLFRGTLLSIRLGLLFIATAMSGGIVISMFSTQVATAAPTTTVNFQAKIQSANGNVVPDGYYNVEFKLYNVSQNGTALWTEDFYDSNGVATGNDNRARVVNGYLSVGLGSQTAFPNTVDWSQQLWVTMNIGGTAQTATPTYDGEMNPRLQLTAVPYAFNAARLGGLDATGFIQNTTTPQTANFNINGTGTANLLQSSNVDTASAGTLTIGTTNATGITLNKNVSLASGVNIVYATGSGNLDLTNSSGFFATGSGTTYLNGDISVKADKSITFAAGSGNLDMTNSTGFFATGSGATYLNGNTTVLNNKTLTANGNVLFKNATNSTAAFQVQNAAGASLLTVDSSNSTVTIGGNLTNNGSTLNTILALSNFAASGAIGTAAATVDTRTSFTVNQTTAGVSLTIPSPTNTTGGRIIYITNIGTVSFNLIGSPLSVNAAATLVWNGTAWVFSGADANSILNQSATAQNASLNISGNATVGGLTSTDSTVIRTASGGSFVLQNASANNDPYFIGAAKPYTNMIGFNPTFEGSPYGWNVQGTGTGLSVGTNSADLTNVYSGRNSWKVVTASGTANTGTNTGSFTTNFVSSTTYTLSFYAKAGDANFSTLRVGFGYNGTENVCSLNSTSVLTSGFQRYSCTFTTGTVTNNRLVFFTVSDTVSHTFYMDNVTLVPGSSATLQAGTGSIDILGVVSSPLILQANSNSTNAFQIQNAAGTSNLFNADTLNGSISVNGNLVLSGTTVNSTLALSNFASDGVIGTAAATVDAYTSFTVNQTTIGKTLTLPSPTTTTAGRVIYVSNVGTTPFTLLGSIMSNGATATLFWNGSIWTFSGADASSILNQSATPQNASLNINGSATFGSNFTQTNGTFTVNAGPSSIMASDFKLLANTGGNDQLPILQANASTAKNLIYKNPGFESYVGYWDQKGSGTGLSLTQYGLPGFANRATTAPNVYDGTYSGLITTANGTANTGYKTSTFTIPVVANTNYNFSFYAKASGSNFTTLTAGMAYDGTTATNCTLNSNSVTTNGFLRYSCSITTPSTGVNAAYVYIAVSDSTTHSFYLDDVQLSVGSDLKPYSIGNISINGVVDSPVSFQSASNSSDAFKIQNASGATMFGVDTLTSYVTVNSLYNSGVTINGTSALGNFTANGAIGTAAATVDITTSFTVNQTTAGISLTVPSPSNPIAGRVIYITNIGSASFNLIGSPLAPNASATLVWTGSVWSFSGADSNSILNQTASLQTANFNIQSAASSSIGGIIRGASSQSVDLLQFQNSNGNVLTKITALGAITTPSLTTTDFVEIGTTLTTHGNVTFGAFDFKLGTDDQTSRGNSGLSRAIVKDSGNILTLNYGGDFTGGTKIDSALNVAGAATFKSYGNTTSAFSVQNTSGFSLLNVDSSNGRVVIGQQSNLAQNRLYFGDTASGNNVWVGESGATDTDALQLQGMVGVNISVGASVQNVQMFDGVTGAVKFKNVTDSALGFAIQDSAGASLFVIDSSTDVIKIGGGDVSPNGTPVLLALDYGNSTTEPTGIEGSMYYNSALTAFRCYQNGNWRNCTGSLGMDYQEIADELDGQAYLGGCATYLVWYINNSTSCAAAPILNSTNATYATSVHPGVMTLQTTATNGNGTNMMRSAVDYSVYRELTFIVRMPATAATTVRFGVEDDSTTPIGQPNGGIYFQFSPANANWMAITRNSGTETSTNTSVAVTAGSWYKLTMKKNASNQWVFSINDTVRATNVTTNNPTFGQGGTVTSQIVSSSAAIKKVDIDYIYSLSTKIGQRY